MLRIILEISLLGEMIKIAPVDSLKQTVKINTIVK
jgi:hypothetical protein